MKNNLRRPLQTSPARCCSEACESNKQQADESRLSQPPACHLNLSRNLLTTRQTCTRLYAQAVPAVICDRTSCHMQCRRPSRRKQVHRERMCRQRKPCFQPDSRLLPSTREAVEHLLYIHNIKALFLTRRDTIFSCSHTFVGVHLFSSYPEFLSAAGSSRGRWPVPGPHYGGCTCWPAPSPASPARRRLQPGRPAARGPCAGRCGRAAAAWAWSPRTGRAAAGPRPSWPWGSQGWRGVALPGPAREKRKKHVRIEFRLGLGGQD